MKKIFILLSCLTILSLSAQEEDEFKTIFGGRSVGGYGGIGCGYSLINEDNALTFNARGGVVMGHFLAMGIGGNAFFTEYQYDPRIQQKASLSGGYGGVFLEFIILGRSPVHISFPVLLGLGGAAYTAWENEGEGIDRENSIEKIASFGVFEPGVELEFNMTKFLRLAAYVNYRFASNLNITRIVNGQPVQIVLPDAMTGYSAGLIFKFGKF